MKNLVLSIVDGFLAIVYYTYSMNVVKKRGLNRSKPADILLFQTLVEIELSLKWMD